MNTNILGFKRFRAFAACAGLLAAVVAFGSQAPAFAQANDAIARAQDAVRERILREQGGSYASVNFQGRRRVETYAVANNQTGVRGEGTFARDSSSRRQRFSYDAVVNTRNGRVLRLNYNFTGDYDGDGDTDRVPRWLVGTFRGYNPSGGRRGSLLTVTIDSSGSVTAVHPNGSRETGEYNGDRIDFRGRPSWSVTRTNRDGFSASSRRTEEFTRISGGGFPGGGGGSTGRVPDWAVGTFRGQTDSGESELTISSDGTATARSLRTGETFYGNYDGRSLRFDWGTYDVQRERDGLRTINLNNRNDQTRYRRANY